MSNENWLKEHHSQIQEEHVKATLKADKGHEAKFLSWKIIDFTEKGDNYATVVTSVEVSYSFKGNDESVTYIVKICPLRGLENMMILQEALFKKEVLAYKNIVPLLSEILVKNGYKPLPIPKFYYNTEEAGSKLIFLEDLRPRGFKMVNRTVGMDVRHCILMVKALATFHGASLLLNEEISLKELLERYPDLKLDWHNFSDKADEMLNEMFGPCVQNSAEILNSLGGYDDAQKWLLGVKDNIKAKMTQLLHNDDPFAVICHGDCWNNNALFRYDDEGTPVEVMLVDLQVIRVASFATDLNYFLMTSITGEVRKENEQQILKAYRGKLASLMACGGEKTPPFTFDQIVTEYRRKHEYGLIFAVMIVFIIMAPKEEIPDFQDVKEEDIPAMVAEMKVKALEMMKKNPLFKSRFLSTFDHMAQHGVFT